MENPILYDLSIVKTTIYMNKSLSFSLTPIECRSYCLCPQHYVMSLNNLIQSPSPFCLRKNTELMDELHECGICIGS